MTNCCKMKFVFLSYFTFTILPVEGGVLYSLSYLLCFEATLRQKSKLDTYSALELQNGRREEFYQSL